MGLFGKQLNFSLGTSSLTTWKVAGKVNLGPCRSFVRIRSKLVIHVNLPWSRIGGSLVDEGGQRFLQIFVDILASLAEPLGSRTSVFAQNSSRYPLCDNSTTTYLHGTPSYSHGQR